MGPRGSRRKARRSAPAHPFAGRNERKREEGAGGDARARAEQPLLDRIAHEEEAAEAERDAADPPPSECRASPRSRAGKSAGPAGLRRRREGSRAEVRADFPEEPRRGAALRWEEVRWLPAPRSRTASARAVLVPQERRPGPPRRRQAAPRRRQAAAPENELGSRPPGEHEAPDGADGKRQRDENEQDFHGFAPTAFSAMLGLFAACHKGGALALTSARRLPISARAPVRRRRRASRRRPR